MITIQERTLRVLAEQTGIAPQCISDEHTLEKDLQCDSLDCIEIMMALEEEFGIHIDQDEGEKLLTVQQVLDYVAGVCTPAKLPVMHPTESLDALVLAEEFMRTGGNDDSPYLVRIRTAIRNEKLRNGLITTLLNVAMENIRELDELKSRYIPLHDTGNGRITEIVQRGHDACAALGYPYVAGESPEDDIEPAGEGWAGLDTNMQSLIRRFQEVN
jgi:acyl carrier protein